MTIDHKVSVVVGGREVRGWSEYTINTSLLEPVSTFEMTLPFDRVAWFLLAPEQDVRITIDGVTVLRGFLEEASVPDGDEAIVIRGRCRMSRLVDESAPAVRYNGLALDQQVLQVARPWFSRVTLSNARNRRILRGRGHKAAAASEPLRISPRKDGLLVEPGQTRWSVIEDLLRQAGLLAWSSGDGAELVIGKPNYGQEVQWGFFYPGARSARTREGNVLSLTVDRSTASRYSRVIVSGSGRGTDVHYGAAVSARVGEARDVPSDPEGVGNDFAAPKRLLVIEPVQSTAEARELAAAEFARRAGQGRGVRVTVPLHGQVVAGDRPTLFAPDTLAHVEDERTGLRGVYLVVACSYQASRAAGEQTRLDLVPRGTELAA